jgi:hypothetical protein
LSIWRGVLLLMRGGKNASVRRRASGNRFGPETTSLRATQFPETNARQTLLALSSLTPPSMY